MEDSEPGWEDYGDDDNSEEEKQIAEATGIDAENLNLHIGSRQNIRTFRSLKFYKDSKESETILRATLKDVPENALRVSVFDEIMMIKISIDLNFLSVPSYTFQTLGFTTEEPVDLVFYMNDTKMINYNFGEEERGWSMPELISLGLLHYQPN